MFTPILSDGDRGTATPIAKGSYSFIRRLQKTPTASFDLTRLYSSNRSQRLLQFYSTIAKDSHSFVQSHKTPDLQFYSITQVRAVLPTLASIKHSRTCGKSIDRCELRAEQRRPQGRPTHSKSGTRPVTCRRRAEREATVGVVGENVPSGVFSIEREKRRSSFGVKTERQLVLEYYYQQGREATGDGKPRISVARQAPTLTISRWDADVGREFVKRAEGAEVGTQQ